MKSFNDNIPLLALKVGCPESNIVDLLKYGKLSEKVRNAIKSPEDYKNAVLLADLPCISEIPQILHRT